MERNRGSARMILVSAIILVATFAAFWPVFQNGFVHFDDPDYVVENLKVQGGITWQSIEWAFTSGHAANWHPLTWISHMLDCMMYGLNPAGHHFTSLLFHAINGVLLLVVMFRLTGAFWTSAVVAGLFALHPLRVESVAWVSERKDVLSGFFFILTLLAYSAYVRRTTPSSGPRGVAFLSNRKAIFPYLSALLLFAFGLMSKPMLVTLPFLLLLLDYWPLRRIEEGKWKELTGLLIEKLPFLVLAIVSSIVTVIVQDKTGTVAGTGLPVESRFANALMAYWQYLVKLVWPINLAIFYPHPALVRPELASWLTWKAALQMIPVCLISVFVLRFRRRWPFLFTGWFWYVGILVPVIGIVQVGVQAMADRYTYIPMIGITIALVWAVRERIVSASKSALSLSVLALVGLGILTNWQSRFWHDDVTLFSRAIAVTRENAVAHQNLGGALELKGDLEGAISNYQASALYDRSAEILVNLGSALLKQGKLPEAVESLREGLTLAPEDVRGNAQLGLALVLEQRYADAIEPLTKVVSAKPDDAQAVFVLASALYEAGRETDSRELYARALLLDGSLYDNILEESRKLLDAGRPDIAEVRLQQAARLKPESADVHKNLGMVQARLGKVKESVAALQTAANLDPTAENYYNLGVVQSLAGRDADAITSYRTSLMKDSSWAATANNLAWLLATHPDAALRDGKEALRLASQNFQAHPDRPAYSGTLDAALAEVGEWEDAINVARQTQQLAENAGDRELALAAQKRLASYQKRQPYREARLGK